VEYDDVMNDQHKVVYVRAYTQTKRSFRLNCLEYGMF